MPTALVLSAGGLFGAYQAGAWKALSERFQPDLVAGTSAGALNGWAIAGGCTAAELMAVWRDPALAGVTRFQFPLNPWKGSIDPAPLARHVQDLYGRFQPRVPFSLTIVEWPRLRQVRVPGEHIRPAHLMASCAVPLGYPPVRIDGRYYVDGGVLEVLPVWAAAEMGATRALAVNVLPVMPSPGLRAAMRVFHLLGRKAPGRGGIQVDEIRPRDPLGSVRDSLVWNPENADRWIRQGEEEARRAMADLPLDPVRY